MEIEEKLKDPKYTAAYSEKKLWDMVLKYAKIVGLDLIYLVLLLFYVLQQPTTPAWAKSIIIAALGYFISPLDAIPDVIPGVGHLDDGVLMLAALGSVAMFITPDTKLKAKERLHIWFGDYDVASLDKVDKKIKEKELNKA